MRTEPLKQNSALATSYEMQANRVQQSYSWILMIFRFIRLCKIICPFASKKFYIKIKRQSLCTTREQREAYMEKKSHSGGMAYASHFYLWQK